MKLSTVLAGKTFQFRSVKEVLAKANEVKSGDTLDTLPLKDFQSVSGAFGPDVYQALELKTCVGGRKVYGGPSPESVKMQIENIQKFVDARA